MVISKVLAKKVALDLLAPQKVNIDKMYGFLIKFIFDEYVASLPAEVIELKKNYPNYFSYSDEIRIKLRTQTLYFPTPRIKADDDMGIEVISNNNGYADLKLDKQSLRTFKRLEGKYQEAKRVYRVLLDQTTNTLLQLRTYKKILQHFPPALEFLPKNNDAKTTYKPVADQQLKILKRKLAKINTNK